MSYSQGKTTLYIGNSLTFYRLARYDVYPIGTSQGIVTVGGHTWDLWYGFNGDMKVYSFVATSTINSFTGDLKDFFTYLTNSKGYPATTQNLISEFAFTPAMDTLCTNKRLLAYQFGTEAFTGGPATFMVNKWSANAS